MAGLAQLSTLPMELYHVMPIIASLILADAIILLLFALMAERIN
jgi:hypothetical protein